MRYMIPAFAALVFATASMSAHAQTATPPSSTAPVPGAKVNRLDQRFTAANTTHDGRLTLDQAKAAKWARVVRNFTRIDAGSKGYVTEADIRSANQAERAAKAAGQALPPAKS